MSQTQLTQHSSHLWISDNVTTKQHVLYDLQNTLCKNGACSTCTICLQIRTKSHPWMQWLEPDTTYTIEQIDQVIGSVQFKLDQDESRFIIFSQAEALTPTCCNRLLKTIEEPHDGYHFVFLTSRPQELLPTLKSRCVSQTFQTQATAHGYHEILEFFTTNKNNNPVQLMRNIDRLGIKESATKEIIDLLIEHFHENLTATTANNQNYQKIQKDLDALIILKKSLLQLPIQGSSKIFWKNFYMTFHQHND